jgi:hypothetical protein
MYRDGELTETLWAANLSKGDYTLAWMRSARKVQGRAAEKISQGCATEFCNYAENNATA